MAISPARRIHHRCSSLRTLLKRSAAALPLLLALLCGCTSFELEKLQWRQYSDTKDGFTVLMPGPVKKKDQTISGEQGDTTMSMHTVKYGNGRFCFVAIAPRQVPDEEKAYAVIEKDIRTQFNRDDMQLISSERGYTNNHPSVDFRAVYKKKGAHFVGRAFTANNRIFVLTSYLNRVEANATEDRKFLDSFQLQFPGSPAASSTPNPDVPETPAAEAVASWTETTDAENSFAFKMPGTPAKAPCTINHAGNHITGYRYELNLQGTESRGIYCLERGNHLG